MEMSASGRAKRVAIVIALALSLAACNLPIPANTSTTPARPAPQDSASGVEDGATRPSHVTNLDSAASKGTGLPTIDEAVESDRNSLGATLPASDVSTPRKMGADIRRFVPDDAAVILEKRGDIDGDGRSDVLLVLKNNNQKNSNPRSLTILRSTPSGSLEKFVDNPNAILCQSCGGMMGDPLSGVDITARGFTIAFEGGSRELWSRKYLFTYSRDADDWYLEEIDDKASDRISGRQEDKQTKREQIGSVSIKSFDASLMAQESDP